MKKQTEGIYCNLDNEKWDPINPNLKAWRRDLRLNTESASNLLGISQRSYSYYQSGKKRTPWSVIMAAEFTYRYPKVVRHFTKTRNQMKEEQSEQHQTN